MLRSIAPAINPKNGRKINYSSGFLRSFYLASLIFGYLWYSSSTAYAANDSNKIEITIRVYSRRIEGFTDQRIDRLHACVRGDFATLRF